MALGDSISNIVSANQYATVTLIPSSGDEWMITAFGQDTTTVYMYMGPGQDTTNYIEMYWSPIGHNGQQNGADLFTYENGLSRYKLHISISNTVNLKVYTAWAGAAIIWWMGIKTKE